MSTTQTDTLSIDGMSCDHCVKLVREALEDVEGVTVDDVEVGAATVTYDADALSQATFADALDDAGFSLAA